MKFEVTIEIDDEVIEELGNIWGMTKEETAEYIKNMYLEYAKQTNDFYKAFIDLVYSSSEEGGEVIGELIKLMLKTARDADKKVSEKLGLKHDDGMGVSEG